MTDTPMFLGSSYPMGIVSMLYDRTGRNRKWPTLPEVHSLMYHHSDVGVSTLVLPCWRTSKTWVTTLEFRCYLVYKLHEIQVFQGLRPPFWIFHFRFLPVWSYIIATTPIGQLNPKNIAYNIYVQPLEFHCNISCIQAEIQVFQVMCPPSLISDFHVVTISFENLLLHYILTFSETSPLPHSNAQVILYLCTRVTEQIKW